MIAAVRDAESRARFIGYRVEYYKLWVFVFSAVLAGIAGALYVPQIGIINPGEFSPANSIEIVIWVAIGGRGTLYGAVVGAVMVNYAKTYFTAALPSMWLYALGALFVLVPLFLPRGVVGAVTAASRRHAPAGAVTARMIRAAWSASRAARAAPSRRVLADAAEGDRIEAGPDASHGMILYLEDITVSFDGFRALNALTLYIEAGELRCIIGPNGAGKTTMMDVITGKTRPDSGSAWFGQTIDLLAHDRAGNRPGRYRP